MVASTAVAIVNTLAIASGATVLVMSLVNLLSPSFRLDALLAKNLIYFFGHVFINATIYMAVIVVYEVLSRATGRPWKSSKPFLAAWTATTLMVLAVYPHHLFMDFVMPTWMLVMGQVLSYAAGFPVLVVTVVGTLSLVHRSGIKWNLVTSLLVLSVFGWGAGVIPAIIDGTIVVNLVMHNTLWVPGHFHFYLILGVVAMNLAFAVFVARGGILPERSGIDRLGFWLFTAGGLGLAFTFLYAGRLGVPRRYAVHAAEWVRSDRLGAIFAAVLTLAILLLAARVLARPKAAATS